MDDGGSPIIGYRIEMRPVGTFCWQAANPSRPIKDTSFTILDLLPETDYEFRIMAENKAGAGPPSGTARTRKYGKVFLNCN